MKIEMGKVYTDKLSSRIRILCIDAPGNKDYCVVGMSECGDVHRYNIHGIDKDFGGSDADLIEIKPRIRRTYWINLNTERDDDMMHETRADADRYRAAGCIACVQVNLDCEEGDGL